MRDGAVVKDRCRVFEHTEYFEQVQSILNRCRVFEHTEYFEQVQNVDDVRVVNRNVVRYKRMPVLGELNDTTISIN